MQAVINRESDNSFIHAVQKFRKLPTKVSEFNFRYQENFYPGKRAEIERVFHLISDPEKSPIVNNTPYSIKLVFCQIYHQFSIPANSSITIKQTLFPYGEYPVHEPQVNYILEAPFSVNFRTTSAPIDREAILKFFVTPDIPHKDTKFTNRTSHSIFVYALMKIDTQHLPAVRPSL